MRVFLSLHSTNSKRSISNIQQKIYCGCNVYVSGMWTRVKVNIHHHMQSMIYRCIEYEPTMWINCHKFSFKLLFARDFFASFALVMRICSWGVIVDDIDNVDWWRRRWRWWYGNDIGGMLQRRRRSQRQRIHYLFACHRNRLHRRWSSWNWNLKMSIFHWISLSFHFRI